MADKKISGLPAVTTPASTDEFEVNQGGTSKKQTRAQIHTLESGEHLVLPQVSEAATPTLAIGTTITGLYAPAANQIGVATSGAAHFFFTGTQFVSASAGGADIVDEVPSATNPVYTYADDFDTGMGHVAGNSDVGVLIAGGVNVLEFGESAAAPNLGFFGTAAVAKPSGVAVTAAGIHAALVTLGLIAA